MSDRLKLDESLRQRYRIIEFATSKNPFCCLLPSFIDKLLRDACAPGLIICGIFDIQTQKVYLSSRHFDYSEEFKIDEDSIWYFQMDFPVEYFRTEDSIRMTIDQFLEASAYSFSRVKYNGIAT